MSAQPSEERADVPVVQVGVEVAEREPVALGVRLLGAGSKEGRCARRGPVRVVAVDPAVDRVERQRELGRRRPHQPQGPARS
eukprot:4716423-Alexandrium_andersonii.AAC.1